MEHKREETFRVAITPLQKVHDDSGGGAPAVTRHVTTLVVDETRVDTVDGTFGPDATIDGVGVHGGSRETAGQKFSEMNTIDALALADAVPGGKNVPLFQFKE